MECKLCGKEHQMVTLNGYCSTFCLRAGELVDHYKAENARLKADIKGLEATAAELGRINDGLYTAITFAKNEQDELRLWLGKLWATRSAIGDNYPPIEMMENIPRLLGEESDNGK